jgi:alkylation response protein AidB-like acyl-CoA dehydrogenase
MPGRRDRSDNDLTMANHVVAPSLRSPQVNGDSTVTSAGHQLVTRARELAPLLRECAAETETGGDITASNVRALREAGMFSFFTPEAFTGREVDVHVAVQAFVELGRGCGASAWVAMILSGGSLMGTLLDDDVRNEIWAKDPAAAVGGVTATSGAGEGTPGGWVVSGQWQPASGIRHAQWAVLGVRLQREDGAAEAALALVPIDDVRIVPTWSVAGMQGTGSETVVAESIFVPDRRILSVPRLLAGDYAAEHPGEPVGGLPLGPLLAGLAIGPIIGMAEAAQELALEQIQKRGPTASSRHGSAVESPVVQLAMASAVSLVDTARLHGFRAVQDLDDAVRGHRRLDRSTSARVMMDAGVVSTTVRRAVGKFLDACGPRAFTSDNPLQRIWRDIEVACRHQLLSSGNIQESYGRAILGVEG